MKKSLIKEKLNKLQLSDIYSLMLFILYKVDEIPEYATLSRLCFLLDGSNLTRLLAHYAGQTIKIPTEDEFKTVTNALLLYQYVNIEGNTLVWALDEINTDSEDEKNKVLQLYLKIIPIIRDYDVNLEQFDAE